ncbi:MAG: nucleotide exchange factor GrpE [Bacteroidaceae bacterium]|nr:nucleotide exchange factor GrpE [Bacteroidaceae bacterium]
MKTIDIEEDERLETPADEEVNEETAETSEEAQAEKEEDHSPEAQLAKAENEIAELKDKYLRQAAEFDNYRKRVIKEKADLIKTGGERMATAILPILDDFERAHETMDKMEDVAAVKEGVQLIIEKFLKLLKQEGLEKMDVVGQTFDTDYHEAIAMVPGQPDEMRGKVLDCVQTGYKLNDKVIRHAKVAVAE